MLLNCHTYYSFSYGTLAIDELLDEVQHKGYRSFVLTDINNTSACLETIRRAKSRGLKPVAGIDFRNGAQQQYVGIAQNNEGFRELNEHLSDHLHRDAPVEHMAPAFNHAFIIYPLAGYKGWALRENEYLGVSVADLKTLPFSKYRDHKHKLVALHQVSFAHKKGFNAHRLLRAIGTNTILSKLPLSEQATGCELMLPRPEMLAVYGLHPHIIANTEALLEQCSIDFTFDKLANKNRQHFLGSKAEDNALLRSKCEEGLSYRYPVLQPHILERMNKELDVIATMNFASYFLINWDITSYARNKNYYHVGRGSGANSIVAYLLRITDVDPIELDLYFERFINIHRSNAPDFDIDFSWTDRDDITGYIFDKYGKDGKAALLGAYNTFQQDAIIRQLGKVFGLPPAEIERLQHADRYPDPDEISRKVLNYGAFMKGFPSHLSIHASGIIISELPITCYSATSMPPKGYPTTQFSMLEAEDIGLYKFDILSQRGLGKIKDALSLIETNKNVQIDIHNIAHLKDDEQVKSLLRTGNTIGCFYVESPAMRMLLAKLEADDYLRLVAASSIIRPGISKSGMMREYIVRYRDPAARRRAQQALPELYHILEETYGVMVYQEDVIKVAHLFAGLTLAEADFLRRGMSWKFKLRNEFGLVKERFFNNCMDKGHPPRLISDIWNQIESFANFAFSKGHSASYAVESYQALYLKAHYPLEYMVATLNNGGGFYRQELYVHEARKHGAEIMLPCINNSTHLCTIHGSSIFLGFNMIAELTQVSIESILDDRAHKGPFAGLEDFVARVPLPIEQMRLLIRAGAFAFTGKGKKEMLWQVHALVQPHHKSNGMPALFQTAIKTFKLPELSSSEIEDAFDERELLGFSRQLPFHLLRDSISSRMRMKDLRRMIGQSVCIVGYLVNVKNTSTGRNERMHFGTFVDLDGEWIDTVHFPPSARQSPFTGNGCYELHGRVTQEYDFISIEVDRMKRLPLIDRESITAATLPKALPA